MFVLFHNEFSAGLDYKKELELERKRQQLKQELSQLEDTDDVRENLHIERQVCYHGYFASDVFIHDVS